MSYPIITIVREDEIQLNDNLFAHVGFSIDAEMTPEERQTPEYPGCQSELNQWINVVIDKNNILFYTDKGGDAEVEITEERKETMIDLIIELAELNSEQWLTEAICW